MDTSVLLAFRYDLDGGVFSANAHRNASFHELRQLWSEHSLLEEEDHCFFTMDGKMLPTSGCISNILPPHQFCLSISVKMKELAEIPADISSDLGSSAPDIAFENATAPSESERHPLPQWLEETLTCPIHLDLFEDPRCLPCGHVYCGACLQQLLKSNKRTCPLCRAVMAVPNNECSALPSIFVVNELIKNILDYHPQGAFEGSQKGETSGASTAAAPSSEKQTGALSVAPRAGPIGKVATGRSQKRGPDFSFSSDTPVSNFEPYDINAAARLPVVSVPRDLGCHVSPEALMQRLEFVFRKRLVGIWVHVATSVDASSMEETVLLVRNQLGTTYFADRQGRRVQNSKKNRNPRLRRSSSPLFVPENLTAVIDIDFE